MNSSNAAKRNASGKAPRAQPRASGHSEKRKRQKETSQAKKNLAKLNKLSKARQKLLVPPDRPRPIPRFTDKQLAEVTHWQYVPIYKNGKYLDGGYFQRKSNDDPNVLCFLSETSFKKKYTQALADSQKKLFINRWKSWLETVSKSKDVLDPEDMPTNKFYQNAAGYCQDDVDRRHYEPSSLQQPFMQEIGTRACIQITMSNMIYFMSGGGREKAELFYLNTHFKNYGVYWRKELERDLKTVFPKKILKRLNSESFDILGTPVPTSAPTLVHMKKMEGCIDHVVGILDSTIYDSCNDFTLSRTAQNIDHACRPCRFKKVIDVVQLQDDPAAVVEAKKRSSTRNRKRYSTSSSTNIKNKRAKRL